MGNLMMKVAAWTAAAGAATALCAVMTWFSVMNVNDDTALPEPGVRVLPTAQELPKLLAGNPESTLPDSQLLLDLKLRLDNRLNDKFHDNLKNIAAQKGWHAATLDYRRMELTLPASELKQLGPLLEDPVRWIHENHRPGRPAVPPDNLDLITATLEIDHSVKAHMGWLVAATISGLGTLALIILSAAALVIYVRDSLQEAKHGQAGAARNGAMGING